MSSLSNRIKSLPALLLFASFPFGARSEDCGPNAKVVRVGQIGDDEEKIYCRWLLKWSGEWGDAEKTLVEHLVASIPSSQANLALGQIFKQWVSSNVVFDRALNSSKFPDLGVVPGRLRVNDTFFASRKTENEQTNLLVFELGKLLWFHLNGNDVHVAQTRGGQEFQMMANKYPAASSEMKFAPLRGTDLGHLVEISRNWASTPISTSENRNVGEGV
jgi:hypothetical protein